MLLRKILCITIISILLFANTISLASDGLYIWSASIESSTVLNEEKTDSSKQTDNPLNLQTPSCVLMEQNTGKVLYNNNMHEKLKPASVTKVMTILLIMEAIDSGRLSYQDKIPCSQTAANMGGSQIWLDTKEELTVDEMLKAICIVSANDCTVAMAEYLAGSEELFVELMNKRAKELGMNNTTFKNCHGLDEDGHETTAYDIALMSSELMKNHPSITKYTTIWMDSLRDGTSELVNTNKLIRNYSGTTGLKTGSTALALYNLSATATRNDLSLIAVMMKSPTTSVRFDEAKKLLDYGFANYEFKKFASKGDIIETLLVNKGIEETVDLIYEQDAGCLIKKGEEKNIVQNINIDRDLYAPITVGQKLGEIIFTLNGEQIAKTNIIAKNEVCKISGWNMITHTLTKWFTLCRSLTF